LKLELKAIKYSKTLSEETDAFTANIYISNKKAGYAKNTGNGGCTEVRVLPEWNELVDKYARRWLDFLEPNPINFGAKPRLDNGLPVYDRMPAERRKETNSYGYLSSSIDQIISNYIVISELKKIKSRVTHTTTTGSAGEYVRYRMKPSDLSNEMKNKIEAESDFDVWLHSMEIDELARKLGHRTSLDGPLVLFAN